MDFVIEPKIRLIGKSIINIDGLISFLDDQGMEWPEFQKKLDSNLDLGDDDGNWLIEFGGRNCYSKDTEVLTSSGWKNLSIVDPNKDKVATLNRGNNCVEWENNYLKTKRKFNGNLIHFKNRNVDIMVTPDHNMLVSFDKKNWTLKTARSLVNAKHVWFKTKHNEIKELDNNPPNKYIKINDLIYKQNIVNQYGDCKTTSNRTIKGINIPLKEYLKLSAMYISEGYTRKRTVKNKKLDYYGITITQNLDRPLFKIIKETIENINGLKYNIQKDPRKLKTYNFQIGNSTLAQHFVENFGDSAFNKKIPEWIKFLPINLLEMFFNTLMMGDGSINNNNSYYCSVSSRLISDVSFIAFRLGKSIGYSESPTKNGILYYTRFLQKEIVQVLNKDIKQINYNDYVYCISTKNGVIYVRRPHTTKRAIFCGNCYQSWPKVGGELKGRDHEDHIKNLIDSGHHSCLEHATFNFQIWNISRSCSHELVRSRIGISYSQLSQRYVDSSDVCYIIPKAIQELGEIKPEILNKWKEFCLSSRNFYEELTTELSELYKENPNKTERRKAARQAARSVLPNATETKIMMTLNGRSVRYFMNLRGGEGVEPEIKKLAVNMFKIMEREFPLIVYKMEMFKLVDGSDGVRTIK